MVNKNLNLYNIFVEVAKSKSYADAANKLGISTVSVCKDMIDNYFTKILEE